MTRQIQSLLPLAFVGSTTSSNARCAGLSRAYISGRTKSCTFVCCRPSARQKKECIARRIARPWLAVPPCHRCELNTMQLPAGAVSTICFGCDSDGSSIISTADSPHRCEPVRQRPACLQSNQRFVRGRRAQPNNISTRGCTHLVRSVLLPPQV